MSRNLDRRLDFVTAALRLGFISQQAAQQYTGDGLFFAEEFLDLYSELSDPERIAVFPLIEREHYARTYGVTDPSDQLIDFVRAGPMMRRHPHPLIHFDFMVLLRPDFSSEMASATKALGLIAEHEVWLSPWLSADLDEALVQLRDGRLDPIVAEWVDAAYLLGEAAPSDAAAWQAILDFASVGDARHQRPSRRFDPTAWVAQIERNGPAPELPFLSFLTDARINGFPAQVKTISECEIVNEVVLRRRPCQPGIPAVENNPDENAPIAFPLSPKQRPLAVSLHIFYLDVARDILDRLQQAEHSLKIYATTSSDLSKPVAELLVKSGLDHVISIVENRGRDIAPFLASLPQIIAEKHDFLLKLHTKKSEHRHDGTDWAKSIFDGLTDQGEMRFALDTMRRHSSIGFAAADGHVLPVKDYMHDNGTTVSRLVQRLALDITTCRRDGYFMAGSMFYARVAALKPLLGLGLKTADFSDEGRQLDGTLAHAVERIIAMSGWKAKQTLLILGRPSNTEVELGSFY